MTNRLAVMQAAHAHASDRLREEIAYYIETYSDNPDYDVADAVHDALNHAEANDDRPMVRDCIDVLIAAGFYRPRTGEVVIVGRDRSPVRGGVRYDCVASWWQWIDG